MISDTFVLKSLVMANFALEYSHPISNNSKNLSHCLETQLKHTMQSPRHSLL